MHLESEEIICPPREELKPAHQIYHVLPFETAMPFSSYMTLSLKESRVMAASVEMGYQHQGLEKSLEQTPWAKVEQEIAKANPYGPYPLRLAFRTAVESLLSVKVSEAVQLSRLIQLEKTRIAHHLQIIRALSKWKNLKGNGIISKENALSFGLTGPVLRATGVVDDIRRNDSSGLYSHLGLEIPTQSEGDVLARLKQRQEEIRVSQAMIEKASKELGDFSLIETSLDQVPRGQYTAFLEAPEGELRVSIFSNGEETPKRIRIRTPSFASASALHLMIKDAHIDDVPMIATSLGIVSYEVDR